MKRFKTCLLVLLTLLVAASMLVSCGQKSESEATKAPSDSTIASSSAPTATSTATSTENPTEVPTAAPTEEPTRAPVEVNNPPEGYNAEDKAPAADLLDLVFDGETAKDGSASQFEITALNDPVVDKDKTINKTVAEFAKEDASMYAVYDFNSSVHDKLSDGFTFEVYVMLYDDTVYSSILGYTQAGGVSIDFDENRGSIGFGIRTPAGYVYLYDTERIDADEYYHVVGVYNGSEISLYCDGELIKTSAAGELVFPSVAKTYLGIGGDLSGNDQGEDQMSGTIALARIYSDALNASQVYNLYLEAVQG
ncbi:MAG: LamG domain-containing protein [Clostridia bacterium]|nr:LamG domain-containing protein [Clostridia bacterium]